MDFELNFQWVSSAQTMAGASRDIKPTMERFGRIMIEDVAIQIGELRYNQARNRLKGQLRQIVYSEVARMANTIERTFALPAKYRGPHGQMSIVGGISQTARNAWGLSGGYTFDRSDTGIGWKERSEAYLREKRYRRKPQNWWKFDGDLVDYLGKPETYNRSFGPISIRFQKARNQGRARGAARTRAGSTVLNLTPPGLPGRSIYEERIGTIEVSVWGRITPAMLPSLLHPNQDPAAVGTVRGLGVSQLLNDDQQKMKLLKAPKGARVRYALEPFVAFYLNRAIPNAIWRRIEGAIEN